MQQWKMQGLKITEVSNIIV